MEIGVVFLVVVCVMYFKMLILQGRLTGCFFSKPTSFSPEFVKIMRFFVMIEGHQKRDGRVVVGVI